MIVERLDLFHVRMPFRRHFETSFGRSLGHEAVIVRAESHGAVGWGEAAASSGPFYSAEDVHTAWHIAREHLAPAIQAKEIPHPSDVRPLFAFVRGNPMAKAGIEMALWDLFAKQREVSLASLYCGGAPDRAEIPAGISLGIEDRVEQLLDRIAEALDARYRRIKIKIKPGWDVEIVAKVRERFGDIPLMVDANAAYRLDDADRLQRLDEFRLTMIEQPLAHDDLVDHAALQQRLETPLCLDESIRSAADVRKAAQLGSCRIVNIKQARVGGPSEAVKVHDACRAAGMPVWCGGLLETGIGRLHNVALATLPNFTLPGDLSASSRYYDRDLIEPPVALTDRGTIVVPSAPGIGHAVDEEALSAFAIRQECLW
jgi:O-succinylbenzoate synthase